MALSVSKKFRFESAHRLAKGYVGKCANIHGHSWNGQVTLVAPEGAVLSTLLDKHDMYVDYAVLKRILKEIEDEFDHKLLLCEEDSDLIEAIKNRPYLTESVVTLPHNPTSEYLAMVIAQWVHGDLVERNYPIGKIIVTVNETCTSECTYTLQF